MRVYRWLLRLSPKALRRDYGAAMEDMFSRRLVEARRQGKRRVAHLWAREFTGLLVLAISERLKGGPEGPPLRDLSRPKAGIMDVTAQEIIDWCREHLAHFKAPTAVIFGPLPKTATGKIQKYVLRETARKSAGETG